MPNKPAPPFVGGRFRYTLNSYEPVEITITIPRITVEEVQMGVAEVLNASGLQQRGIPSDEWIAQNVDGVSSLEELRQAVREHLEAMQQEEAETSKLAHCTMRLSERLEQSVPASEVERAHADILEDLESHMAETGYDLSQALAGAGVDRKYLDDLLAARAEEEASGAAALDAMADHMGMTVDETELPGLFELSPRDVHRLIEDAKLHGDLDELLQDARRIKVEDLVVSECRCTYQQETEEEASRRGQELFDQMERWVGQYGISLDPSLDEDGAGSGDQDVPGSGSSPQAGPHAHLRLV